MTMHNLRLCCPLWPWLDSTASLQQFRPIHRYESSVADAVNWYGVALMLRFWGGSPNVVPGRTWTGKLLHSHRPISHRS